MERAFFLMLGTYFLFRHQRLNIFGMSVSRRFWFQTRNYDNIAEVFYLLSDKWEMKIEIQVVQSPEMFFQFVEWNNLWLNKPRLRLWTWSIEEIFALTLNPRSFDLKRPLGLHCHHQSLSQLNQKCFSVYSTSQQLTTNRSTATQRQQFPFSSQRQAPTFRIPFVTLRNRGITW